MGKLSNPLALEARERRCESCHPDMKTCSACGETKELGDFHKRTSSKDGYQTRCKNCNKEQRKEYYKTAHGRDRSEITGKRAKRHRTQLVIDYLSTHPCVDCGEADIVVLDFDHRDPKTKFKGVSVLVRNGYSVAVIEEEMAKCDVRCANCHRRRTAQQFNWLKLG